jgi:hypothetical protein
MATTKHDCGGPVFGRKTPGCPRCDELLSGAAPVVWGWSQRRNDDERWAEEIRRHDCTVSRCGYMCTFGES